MKGVIMAKIDSSLRDSSTASRMPLEQISIEISSAEKQELQRLADEKDLPICAVARRAIQAYLFALRTRKKKVKMQNIPMKRGGLE